MEYTSFLLPFGTMRLDDRHCVLHNKWYLIFHQINRCEIHQKMKIKLDKVTF